MDHISMANIKAGAFVALGIFIYYKFVKSYVDGIV